MAPDGSPFNLTLAQGMWPLRLTGVAGSAAVTCPIAVSAGRVRRPRHVERGIPVEEAHGLEHEPDARDRHHRPVLGPDDVMSPEGVPEDHVRVRQRRVVPDVGWQPGTPGMLVRIVAGGVPLTRVVAGHPEVPRDEAGPAGHG